jgi:hypothetical protein
MEFSGLAASKAAKQEKFKTIKAKIEQAAKELKTSLELPLSDITKGGFKDIKKELNDYITVLTSIKGEEVLKDTDASGKTLEKTLEETIDKLSQVYNKTGD